MEERELNEFASEIQDNTIKRMFVFLIRGFTDVKKEIHDLSGKVDKLQTITVVQENGKKLEHTFQRSAFFQSIYDEIETLKQANRHRVKNTVTSISFWAKAIIPILVVIGIILGLMGYNDLAEQIKNINN